MEQQMQQQRQRDAQRQAAEDARQKNAGLKWAARAQANPAAQQPVKSLLEIQAEEEKELKKVSQGTHTPRGGSGTQDNCCCCHYHLLFIITICIIIGLTSISG